MRELVALRVPVEMADKTHGYWFITHQQMVASGCNRASDKIIDELMEEFSKTLPVPIVFQAYWDNEKFRYVIHWLPESELV